MTLRLPWIALLALTASTVASATAKAQLVAALSNHLVAITTGFSGTDVLLFGAIDGTGDVVVVVRGPESVATVHRKGRTLGIWVNEADMAFANVPGFWAMASTGPLQELVPQGVAEFHQLGLAYLNMKPLEQSSERRVREFREALIRTNLWIPANAPIGTYTVSIYLIRDNDLVSAETTPLIVGKVGFEARVYDFAHRLSWAYGILAVLIAAVAGWTANLAFRKG
jgi:hypothetical protein